MNTQLPWHKIDTVLLDMDGTLLDLHFDAQFWLRHLPQRYSEHHQTTLAEAIDYTVKTIDAQKGTLNWYCLDYWTQEFGFSMRGAKEEIKHLIAVHPGVLEFLDTLQSWNKRVAIVTNAHRDALDLKLEETALHHRVDKVVVSHDYNKPKEDRSFWDDMQKDFPFNPERTLFIDDNLDVLRSARDYGVKYLLAIDQPDSQSPSKDTMEFEGVKHFADITPRMI